ncbi:MAG TPA: SUMF1/EgtB/PvdO family nonheme iron enzyme [Polyangiaceae bacterium]|nr:SUMF1/EgtB/PvdO family nonheme iron enzyme [Polyangiaceae bacterium]
MRLLGSALGWLGLASLWPLACQGTDASSQRPSEQSGGCAICSNDAGRSADAPAIGQGGAAGGDLRGAPSQGGDGQSTGVGGEGAVGGDGVSSNGSGDGGRGGEGAMGPDAPCTICVVDSLCEGADRCGRPPSCSGLAATCGPDGNSDCCTSTLVPGGTYNRSNDSAFPATVSDFRLDRYEITVGRFRKFVDAFSQHMIAPGAGKNPNNASDPGWDGFLTALSADADALRAELKCDSANQSWTDAPGDNESLPMNCLDWYVANGFCIWDGGRLPTEAEWNYAAAGGDEQRKYPWGAAEPAADTSLAVHDCYLGEPWCAGKNFARVGSVSAGNGRWGHADLSGSVFEWTLDWFEFHYPMPCYDCANLTEPFPVEKALRGGAVGYPADFLPSSKRFSKGGRSYSIGVRCARTPLPAICSDLPPSCAPNSACCGPPPARGAFSVSFPADPPPPSFKSCPVRGETREAPAVALPEEKLSPTSYQHALVHGQAGAVVHCSLQQDSPLGFSAVLRSGSQRLAFKDVVFGADFAGTGSVLITDRDEIGSLFSVPGTCPFHVFKDSAGLPQAAPNKIYGSFDCSVESPPNTSCAAKGIFVLENCTWP